MGRNRSCQAARGAGFTMVEMVSVIVILGILGVATSQFITDSSSGLMTTVDRTEPGFESRLATERLTRSLRAALPNSVRVNGDGSCIEFVPVITGSYYVQAPFGNADTSMTSAPVALQPLPTTARVAIQPTSDLYSLANPGPVSPVASAGALTGDNEVKVTLASSHEFSQRSPTDRYFWVDSPISYCVTGGKLWRYSSYGFNAAQLGVGSLPSSPPDRTLIAEEVATASGTFSVTGTTLTRGAVVSLQLAFARGSEEVDVSHVVQVRHVP